MVIIRTPALPTTAVICRCSRYFQDTQVEARDVQHEPDEEDAGHGGEYRMLCQPVLQLGERVPDLGAECRPPVLLTLRVIAHERPLPAGYLKTEHNTLFICCGSIGFQIFMSQQL